jgi:hypothetical protein
MATAKEHRIVAEMDLEKFRATFNKADAARKAGTAEGDDEFDELSFNLVKYGVGALVHALLAIAPEEKQ